MRLIYTSHHFSWKHFFQKHRQTIKYSLFVLCIIGTLLGIRIYINYAYITSAIEQEKLETKRIVSYNDYLHFYRKQYITSPYAAYFQNHENNRIYPGEFLVVIRTGSLVPKQHEHTQSREDRSKTGFLFFSKTPSQQRQELWKRKLMKIFQE